MYYTHTHTVAVSDRVGAIVGTLLLFPSYQSFAVITAGLCHASSETRLV